jgi:phosphoglycolate phosphatase-like HAD superfamily hydrolase
MTAGVFSGNSSREDLAASGADFTAANCGELMQVLRAEGLI